MLYLSQLINAPIRDRDGERIATVRDLIARMGEGYPPVTGVVARQGRRDFFIPIGSIAGIDADGVTLSSAKLNIAPLRAARQRNPPQPRCARSPDH